VQIVFPVEIEVIAGGGEAEIRDATELVMRRAADKLNRLA